MGNPIGEAQYMGLAVPLRGESQIYQQTTNTILTLELTSAEAGEFLLGRNSVSSVGQTTAPANYGSTTPGKVDAVGIFSSVRAVVAQWAITNQGGYQALQGTSAVMELNTSGIFGGHNTSATVWSVDTSGRFIGNKQAVVDLATGANATLQSSQSGAMVVVRSQSAGTAMFIILPNDPPVGTWYDIWLSSQTDLDDVQITSTGVNNSVISMPGVVSSLVSTGDVISPGSTQTIGITLTYVQSALWVARGDGLSMLTTDPTAGGLEMASWDPGSSIG